VKPLSEQLKELSIRAKKAEDDAAAAKTETHAALQARVDKLQADTTARTAKIDAAAATAKDAAVGQWTTLQTQVKDGVARIKADLAVTKAEQDAARAERKAERAENSATAAIAFAYDAIDYAELAVLDAVIARTSADAM
jgi:hypothetical protein